MLELIASRLSQILPKHSLIREFFKAQGVARGGKYFKREWVNNRWKYYYTEAEYKQAKGEKGGFGIFSAAMNFFGFDSETRLTEKMNQDIAQFQRETQDQSSEISRPSLIFKNTFLEYFANKQKYTEFFARKRRESQEGNSNRDTQSTESNTANSGNTENQPVGSQSERDNTPRPKQELTPEQKKEKEEKKFKLKILKWLDSKYGGIDTKDEADRQARERYRNREQTPNPSLANRESENNFETMPETETDPVLKNLSGDEQVKAIKKIKEAVQKSLIYLGRYPDSPFTRAIRGNNINLDSILNGTNSESGMNIKTILERLHENLKQIDRVHASLGRPSNADAQRAGGYGNLIYNDAVKKLVEAGLLPQGYENIHKREGKSDIQIPSARDLAEVERQNLLREEQEAERIRLENKEVVNRQKANVQFAENYFGKQIRPKNRIKIAIGFEKAFGKNFNFEEWTESIKYSNPNVVSRLEIDLDQFIRLADRSNSNTTEINFNYVYSKSSGDRIGHAQRSIEKKSDGSYQINNKVFNPVNRQILDEYPGLATSANTGSQKLLKKIINDIPENAKKNSNMYISCCANSGFGDGYKGIVVWAKQGFDFAEESTKTEWKSKLTRAIDTNKNSLGLSAKQVREFKQKIAAADYPYQFVYTGIKLSKEQCQRGGGFDKDVERIIQKDGGYDLGEWLAIKSLQSWKAVKYSYPNPPPEKLARAKHLQEWMDAKANRRRNSESSNQSEPSATTTTTLDSSTQTNTESTEEQQVTQQRESGGRQRRNNVVRSQRGEVTLRNGTVVTGDIYPSGIAVIRNPDNNSYSIVHAKTGHYITNQQIANISRRISVVEARMAAQLLSRLDWNRSNVGLSEKHRSLYEEVANRIRNNTLISALVNGI